MIMSGRPHCSSQKSMAAATWDGSRTSAATGKTWKLKLGYLMVWEYQSYNQIYSLILQFSAIIWSIIHKGLCTYPFKSPLMNDSLQWPLFPKSLLIRCKKYWKNICGISRRSYYAAERLHYALNHASLGLHLDFFIVSVPVFLSQQILSPSTATSLQTTVATYLSVTNRHVVERF